MKFFLTLLIAAFCTTGVNADIMPGNLQVLSSPETMDYPIGHLVYNGKTFCTPYDNAQTALLDLLQESHNQCLVAMYTLANPVIVDELINLHSKGIDVEIILDKTQSAGKNEGIAIGRLRHAGIPLFIGKSKFHQIMHNKFVEVDDAASADGSYNWTESANLQDNILHIDHDPILAEQLHSYWNQIKQDLQ